MQEFIINTNSSGQRLDRYIKKLLPEIPTNLISKSIRKKNITVNNKKQKNNYILNNQDTIQIFFSDETLDKFKGKELYKKLKVPNKLLNLIENPIYEDEDFIALNKPENLLSQPDKSGDISVSDLINITGLKDETFSPAPLNRLDRNTTGIIIIPKNYKIQKEASELIRNRNSKKEYLTLVKGEITEPKRLENSFSKDNKSNLVTLSDGNDLILDYKPLYTKNGLTLLLVDLITGKSHQIRAQLAKAGYPIIGDIKYGDKGKNKEFERKYNLSNQLLHAFSYKLGSPPILEVTANLPDKFQKILKEELGLRDGFLEEATHLKR